MYAKVHYFVFRLLSAVLVAVMVFVVAISSTGGVAKAQSAETMPIWRLQAWVLLGDVKDAGTDDSVSLQIGDSQSYWLDYGRNDFERRSDFTYDIPFNPDQVDSMDDIWSLNLSKTGDDGMCVSELQLLVNGAVVFEWTSNPCIWLDNDKGDNRTLSFSREELRANPYWQENPAMPPYSTDGSTVELRIPRGELESRIEGIIGNSVHGTRRDRASCTAVQLRPRRPMRIRWASISISPQRSSTGGIQKLM